MIKKLILSTLLFCGIATAAPTPAPTSTLDAVLERGVLRVGFDAGYQPFEMTNKQGQYIGFDVDLAKMVAKEMGVKVEFVNTAWDGIIPALLTNKFD
ncbi:TPA: transporter substrate-binding domain-containing protein, partial [Aeromonas veronii]